MASRRPAASAGRGAAVTSGTPPRLYALVPAAGGGSRFGGPRPKQYVELAGWPLLARTIDRLGSALALEAIVVALAPDDEMYDALVGPRQRVQVLRCGGATRAATVANALAALVTVCAPDDWILVHDAARPCVPVEALQRLAAELAADPVGGLLAIPVADTLKRADPTGADADVLSRGSVADRAASAGDASGESRQALRVLRTEDRSALWCAQTPQMFRFAILRDALALPGARTATDEAQAVEALAATGACARPRLVQGSPLNLKLTYPEDLVLATAILAAQEATATGGARPPTKETRP